MVFAQIKMVYAKSEVLESGAKFDGPVTHLGC
jgi:hypothetical protein